VDESEYDDDWAKRVRDEWRREQNPVPTIVVPLGTLFDLLRLAATGSSIACSLGSALRAGVADQGLLGRELTDLGWDLEGELERTVRSLNLK